MTYNRAKEIYASVLEIGKEATAAKYGIKKTSVERQCRRAKNSENPKEQFNRNELQVFEDLKKQFSLEELRAIAKPHVVNKSIDIDFTGEIIKIGYITDTHIGSKYFNESWFYAALDEFHKQDVDFIVHTGDVTEGVSNRAGHFYECSHFGYTAQKEYAKELFSYTDKPIKMISGNHDGWFVKQSGAYILQDLADTIPNIDYLGHNDAILSLKGINIMLWHGEDGAAQTHSLRPQKVVDSLYVEERPDVILMGHTHKAIYYYERGVHVVSGGALSGQTGFMRGKRIISHSGFHIIYIVVSDGKIKKFTPDFYPFYK